MSEQLSDQVEREKRKEIGLFLFLAAILIPGLTVMLVGGYGFSIWIMQILTGPPVG